MADRKSAHSFKKYHAIASTWLVEHDPQERLRRRTVVQNVGKPFAVQQQARVVLEAQKYRDEDEANKMKIEAKSVEEHRDEDAANKVCQVEAVKGEFQGVLEDILRRVTGVEAILCGWP